jgi:hypothetical protein
MARRSRGPKAVDHLPGSDAARQRVRLALETLSGAKTVEQAAAELGVSTQRFHEIRTEALQGAIAACEPKPAGRPPQVAPEADPMAWAYAEREQAIKDLRIELECARLREELIATGLIRRFPRWRGEKGG